MKTNAVLPALLVVALAGCGDDLPSRPADAGGEDLAKADDSPLGGEKPPEDGGDPLDAGCAMDDDCPVQSHCDRASGACVAGCHADEGCAVDGDAGADGGGAAASRCDVAAHACVECLADEHCPPGTLCGGGRCVPGCSPARGCAGAASCCGGACVDTQTSVTDCGDCGVTCAAPNATPACEGGRCVLGACLPGYADCNHVAEDGCETDTRASLTHCGACGMQCGARPHATAACEASACRYACAAPYADCDGAAANGCEADTRSSLAHCGGCGRQCAPPSATAACDMGRCAIAACAAGRADCDGDVADGCEVDVRSSAAHCGGCGRACPAGQGCASGACRVLRSCAEVHEALPALPSGAYPIDPDGPGGRAPFTAWCDMASDGGGWTLALKVDGASATFLYDSPQWASDATLNAGSTDLSTAEAKLEPFVRVPFTAVRLAFLEGGVTRAVSLRTDPQPSLRAMFVSDTYQVTRLGRESWMGLLASASLHRACNREGFNNNAGAVRVRLGILGDQTSDCASPDSRIGLGGAGASCVAAHARNAAGNAAACAPEAGDRDTRVFAFLFVR